MEIIRWILSLHNSEVLSQMIANGGIPVVTLIIFAETGLLVGFFLPGDSLLITAGVLTSSSAIGGRPLLPLFPLLICASVAAVAGNQSGYFLGTRGNQLFINHPGERIKRFLKEAKEFFNQYGSKSIIYARFIPIMRTFVPFAAGLSRMSYKKFLKYDFASGIIWIFSMVLIGHSLGKSRYADQLHKILLIVIFVSILPIIVSGYKRYKRK